VALKHRYRDHIIGARRDVRLVHLEGRYDLIARRMAQRPHHYMPVTLLESQFHALEPLAADENPLVMSIESAPAEIVRHIVTALGLQAT